MNFEWDERKNQTNIQNTIRIISFRKATNEERQQYEQAYKDEFGTP